MQGESAIYRDKIIDKKHFRVFIYNANGERKLVESWEKFQDAMQSGLWFVSKKEAQTVNVVVQHAEPVIEKEVEVVETVTETVKEKSKTEKTKKPEANAKNEKI